MHVENDRLEIIAAAEIAAHKFRARKARLETNYFILFVFACQPGRQGGISRSGGDMHAGRDYDSRTTAKIRQGKDFGAASDSGCSASQQEKGDVAAQPLRQLNQAG